MALYGCLFFALITGTRQESPIHNQLVQQHEYCVLHCPCSVTEDDGCNREPA